eukprot:360753-Chlamydomonas_euryale.AAC.11
MEAGAVTAHARGRWPLADERTDALCRRLQRKRCCHCSNADAALAVRCRCHPHAHLDLNPGQVAHIGAGEEKHVSLPTLKVILHVVVELALARVALIAVDHD